MEGDVPRELCGNVYFPRKDFRTGRDEQYVIEGEAFRNLGIYESLHCDKIIWAKIQNIPQIAIDGTVFPQQAGSSGGRRREETALECIAGFKPVVEEMENLEIADQTPFSLIDESRRHLACHPLYVQVGTETFQNVGDKIEIIVQRQPQEVSRTGPELFFNPGSADYLKLVELYGMKRQGGDEGTLEAFLVSPRGVPG